MKTRPESSEESYPAHGIVGLKMTDNYILTLEHSETSNVDRSFSYTVWLVGCLTLGSTVQTWIESGSLLSWMASAVQTLGKACEGYHQRRNAFVKHVACREHTI